MITKSDAFGLIVLNLYFQYHIVFQNVKKLHGNWQVAPIPLTDPVTSKGMICCRTVSVHHPNQMVAQFRIL